MRGEGGTSGSSVEATWGEGMLESEDEEGNVRYKDASGGKNR